MSDEYSVPAGELGDTLRQVSGQLRLSLANIYNALERLAPPDMRDVDGRLDTNAAILAQSYFRIMRLADNLEDAARLGGTCAAKLKNEDIVGLCRRLASEAQGPAELLGLELTFRCGQDICIIAIDAQRIERLVLNLLSNAFKFTPKGGKISLEIRAEKDLVTLLVSDTGCGISPELQDTIFDRYRHTRRLDPPPHGLGLGLPICRQTAIEHGGNLLLASKEGEGTTVTVSLPRRKTNKHSLGSVIVIPRGGFSRTLVELSDALPREAFTRNYMD